MYIGTIGKPNKGERVTTTALNRIDAATLSRLLQPALGRSADVSHYRVITKSTDYAVIAVALVGPTLEVVVKLAGPRATLACPFERTAAIVGLVRSRTAVPTFEVLAVDVSYRTWPWRYLVMTAVPGPQWAEARPGSTGERARGLNAALGRAVAQLHAVRFPACGEVGADGSVVDGAAYHEALAERARRRIANPAHASLFIALLREHAELFEGITGGALCHEDLNPHNLL
jgi:hypothetical protein